MTTQAFIDIASQLAGTPWRASEETVSGVPTAVLVRRLRRPSAVENDPDFDPVHENRVKKGHEFCRLTSENTFKTKYVLGDGSCLERSERHAPAEKTSDAGSVAPPQIRFGELPTVRAMRSGLEAPVIGFDTEFTYDESGDRVIDSYQFSAFAADDSQFRYDIVLMPLEPERLAVEDCLAIVLRETGLWESFGLPSWLGIRHRDFWVAGRKRRDNLKALFKLARCSVVLAGHTLKADLSAFKRPRSSRYADLLLRVTSASGGLVTLRPARLTRVVGEGSSRFWLPLSVTVRDTLTQTSPGSRSLAALGASCGVPKLSVGDAIEDMTAFKRTNLIEFLEYSANDSVIVLEYLTRLWGLNSVPPVTLSGGGAHALRDAAKECWWGSSDVPGSLFSLRFQGLVRVDRDLETDDDGLSYYAMRGLTPVDGAANQTHSAFKRAYLGGWNGCLAVGYFPEKTFDHDIKSAYPSAMASIVDVDYEHPGGVIEEVIDRRELVEDDFTLGFVTPLVAYCSWEFPEGVEPCLPVVIGQSVVYLRASEGLGAASDDELVAAGASSFSGAWCSAPELLLALRLGAKIFVQIGYRLRVLEHGGEPSRVLRYGVKRMVEDRDTAKRVWGKKSLEEQTIKVATNSAYGKTAQDVKPQNAWNSWSQEMEAVGGSAISSPYHACMTTGLVRALLLAMANQTRLLSVTTDGFISPTEMIEGFDCFGLSEVFRESRKALVGDPTVWEVKHSQSDLINLTTRGNVSLESGGVFAKAGLKAPAGLSDAEARAWFRETALSREGKIPNRYKSFTPFRLLSRELDRVDFRAVEMAPEVSLDFDMKRKPLPPVDSEVGGHAIACFDTVAWEDAHAYRRGRAIAQHIATVKPGTSRADGVTGCLRTSAEWQVWHARFNAVGGRRIRDLGADFLAQLVCAYKAGLIEVPQLDSLATVAEKLEWLSGLGFGEITRARWDSYSREDRQKRVLSNTDWMELNWFLEDLQAAA